MMLLFRDYLSVRQFYCPCCKKFHEKIMFWCGIGVIKMTCDSCLRSIESGDDDDIDEIEISCICPKCGVEHRIVVFWTGRRNRTPRFFYIDCRNRFFK
jgi:hypothetical protein